jgi:hypothetical protein
VFIDSELSFSYLFDLDDRYASAHVAPYGASAEHHQFMTGC